MAWVAKTLVIPAVMLALVSSCSTEGGYTFATGGAAGADAGAGSGAFGASSTTGGSTGPGRGGAGGNTVSTGGSGGASGGASTTTSGGMTTVVTCDPGSSCVPKDPCHEGERVCDSELGSCRDTGEPRANGTSCGGDSTCRDGTCVTCIAGDACELMDSPCRVGSIDCSSGEPVCAETDNQPNGTSCEADKVCQEGRCTTCVDGDACTPENPCHNGELSCAGAAPTCVDLATNVAPGSACGENKVCDASGACDACEAGTACTMPDNPCRSGAFSCNTGQPVCVESGNTENGTSCGGGKVCSGGACVGCSSGLSCVPATDPCKAGLMACSPTVVCNATTESLPNGSTTCGPGKVCGGGQCVACVEGDPCGLADVCKTGTISCTTGAPVCKATGNAAAGKNCGDGKVCSAGACVACANGESCTPTANPCHDGTLDCATGAGICKDTGRAKANGYDCGDDLVCRTGSCVACKEASCTSTNPCKLAATSCATGSAVCLDTGNKPAGTFCDTAKTKVCNSAGACVACVEASDCEPANKCHKGTLSCSSGAPVCVDTGQNSPAGETCGTDLVCNGAGACIACDEGAECPTTTCKVGRIACATGAPVCVDSTTNKAAGTACGSGNASCVASGSAMTCTCKAGYSGTGATCADINECATNNGGCDRAVTCMNTAGSFSCPIDCPAGYLGTGNTSCSRVSPVAGGSLHTCAIQASGSVECNGVVCSADNTDGQCSAATGAFVSLCGGQAHTCGIRTNQNLICWGSNTNAQVRPTPTGTFKALSCGRYHTCAIRATGEVVCWGLDTSAQVSGAPATGQYRAIAAGTDHTCAVRDNGATDCWGDDATGEVSARPTEALTMVASGGSHSCGIRAADQTVICWGQDTNGKVSGRPLTTKFTRITASSHASCGITTTGAATCWGNNDYQVVAGVPTTGTFKEIDGGAYHLCALTSTGKMICWGNDDDGPIWPSSSANTTYQVW